MKREMSLKGKDKCYKLPNVRQTKIRKGKHAKHHDIQI